MILKAATTFLYHNTIKKLNTNSIKIKKYTTLLTFILN
jgi:hypothetical protein